MQSLAAAVAAALLMSAPACAARLGHSRIVSAPGQPLKIDVPLVGLDAVEQSTLKVWLARPAAWRQAGLTPPVSLDSMQVRVTYGADGRSRLVRISSSQPFDGTVADVLLGVSSAEGEQQYQISILSNARGAGAPALAAGPSVTGAPHGAAAHRARTIRVRRGDTMFAIARRNAVHGVTVYQMMIALQRANPRAFIHHNLNLVKAGAALAMPDRAALTAVSDREARRLFMQQAREFEAYRQRLAGGSMAAVAGASASGGKVSAQSATPRQAPAPHDHVVLSSGASGPDHAADQETATGKAVADSRQRIAELEKNVHRLDQALQGGTQGSPGGVATGGASSSSGGAGDGASGGIAAPMLADAARRAAASRHGAAGEQGDSKANVGSVTSSGSAGGSGTTGGSGTDQSAAGGPGAGQSTTGGSGSATGQSTGAAGAASADGAAAPGTPASPGASAATAASQEGGADNPGASPAASGSNAAGSGTPAGGSKGGAENGTPATGASSGTAPSGGSASSAEGASSPGAASSGAASAAGNGAAGDAHSAAGGKSAAPGSAASNNTGKNVSWIQEHMLGIVTALLALVVLIIAWVLRRINTRRDDIGNAPRITEAMVQEKLDQINLDLRESSGDRSAPAKD